MNDGIVYVFVGEGIGIPGLPHRVTQVEAAQLGLSDVLSKAITDGSYAFIQPKAEVEPTPAFNPVPYQPSGVIDLADGVDNNEASLAGQALARHKKEKGN
jgi:hypothetical protein